MNAIVSPIITDDTSLLYFYLYFNYYLSLTPDKNTNYRILYFSLYKTISKLLLSSYKLPFVITILIQIKNTEMLQNFINFLPIKSSQNSNPPNFFRSVFFFDDTFERRICSQFHKFETSNLPGHASITSDHRPFVSRKIPASRFQGIGIIARETTASPVEDVVQRTTKLFCATRSANSPIGSAPDPVFFALSVSEAC